MYNTVIFDLDGTLLNTLDDLCDSTNYALAKNGFPIRTVTEVRRFVGNGIKKLIERALPAGTGEQEFEMTFRDFKEYYGIHCNDKTAPYEGIIPLLKSLKEKGIKVAIASNKVTSAVLTLDEIYFKGLTDAACGADENTPTKPAPDMVEKILAGLKAEKSTTLYVGDSQVDVATAKNAGLRMVAVLWGFRDREELEEAGVADFIENPMELLDFFNEENI